MRWEEEAPVCALGGGAWEGVAAVAALLFTMWRRSQQAGYGRWAQRLPVACAHPPHGRKAPRSGLGLPCFLAWFRVLPGLGLPCFLACAVQVLKSPNLVSSIFFMCLPERVRGALGIRRPGVWRPAAGALCTRPAWPLNPKPLREQPSCLGWQLDLLAVARCL